MLVNYCLILKTSREINLSVQFGSALSNDILGEKNSFAFESRGDLFSDCNRRFLLIHGSQDRD